MNLDGLETAARSQKGKPGCAMGRLLQSLPEDDRDRLRAVMDDPATSGPKLTEFLASRGADVSYPILSAHRSGNCGCEKAGWR